MQVNQARKVLSSLFHDKALVSPNMTVRDWIHVLSFLPTQMELKDIFKDAKILAHDLEARIEYLFRDELAKEI